MASLLGFPKIILSSILFLNFCLQIHPFLITGPISSCNNAIGNYTQNSKFQLNLNNTLSSITESSITYGFFNYTAGDGVDQVNSIALCRGDLNIETCLGCVKNALINITDHLCPNQKEVVVWFDYCMFKYSNKSFIGTMSLDPAYYVINTQNASDVTTFRKELVTFAGILVDNAYNGSFRKYAGMKSNNSYAQTVYGMMQCTPDITPGDCKTCLESAEKGLSGLYNYVGGHWVTPSCAFHYETSLFLNQITNQTPPPPPPLLLSPPPLSSPLSSSTPPPPTITGNSKSKTIIIVVCVIVALLVSSACVFITKRRLQRTSRGQEIKEEDELQAIGDAETRQYDFSLIKAATNHFSTANILGRGGFGDVYKGVLPDGKKIAVKRLSTTSRQGENEFKNEVMLLTKLQHKCLVRLLGFCLDKKERLLIYEFMANGSLDNILFANEVNQSSLDWRERYRIINNIAKGLVYLHEDSRLMIIHRDLKASNILLDDEMNAKISDFGTARLFDLDESEANTKRIFGTMGYMAPEYAMHGMFSVKSDVYSFGVLFLEIISGKRNSITEVTPDGLLSYAYKTWKERRAFDLIDPIVMAHSYPVELITRCIHIALLCVQENIGSRPTMATVILMLQSLTIPMPLPSEPGFYGNTRSWFSQFQESTSSSSQSKLKPVNETVQSDLSLNEETNSYLYPR